MSRLFLFGTLRWPALLADVAGRPVATRPARLDGWSVQTAAAGPWPVLVPGDAAEGLLTEPLDPEALDRLHFYEAIFGYRPERVTVATDAGPVEAAVYRADDAGTGAPWSLEDWCAARGTTSRLAVPEIMRLRGRADPRAVGARYATILARAHAIAMGRAHDRPATVGGELTRRHVAVDRVDHPYEGFHRVEEWHLSHATFAGGRLGPMQRAVSNVTDAATVLPYDPARDRVLVIEQIRVGALAKGDPRPWMLEPVAGLIDAGEDAVATALRETAEEAGLRIGADALRFVARYYPSPGGLAQVLHSYVALCDLPDGAAGLGGLDGEHEDIRGHLLALDDLLAMIETTEAANAPLILSAQWLALNRGRLHARRA